MIENFDNLLRTTRSVRRKLDLAREIPTQVLEDCINVAVQAPVSLAGENWRFLIVNDQDTKQALAAIYREVMLELSVDRGIEIKSTHKALMKNLPDIPCMILIFAIGQPQDTVPQQIAFYGSILPAAWSLMLALRARGLGTTWTTLLSSRQTQVADLLGIPDNVTQTVMLPIAYTKDAVLRPAERLSAKDVTYHNRWGNTQ